MLPQVSPSSPHPWSGLQLSSSSGRFLLDLCECLAVVLLMQHGSGPYFVKQVKRGQGQKCTKTGKPGEKYVIFEQVQGTPVVIMLSGDVSGPLVTLCSLDILQRCRRPAAAALQTLQPDCRSILPLGGHMGSDNRQSDTLHDGEDNCPIISSHYHVNLDHQSR